MIWLTRGEYEVLKAALRTLRYEKPTGDTPEGRRLKVAILRNDALIQVDSLFEETSASVREKVGLYIDAITDAYLAGTLTQDKLERLHSKLINVRFGIVYQDIGGLERSLLAAGADLVNG
jgi:hypothetical protein